MFCVRAETAERGHFNETTLDSSSSAQGVFLPRPFRASAKFRKLAGLTGRADSFSQVPVCLFVRLSLSLASCYEIICRLARGNYSNELRDRASGFALYTPTRQLGNAGSRHRE
jgi:hypothetical protein